MTDVLATAADAAYGYHALNLVGSVKRNSDVFDRIEVYDLGLAPQQRELLSSVPGVVVRDVPAFAPHWAQCFTWKPWAWMQIGADRVFWLDAGATVLRSLVPALGQIGELGYFVVSQGNQLLDIVPDDYFELYGLSRSFAPRPYVAAGIVGFRPGGDFVRRVLMPTYDDCMAGRNLGFSPGELTAKNHGIGHMESPPLRNCAHFRWDQTLLNIHLALELPNAEIADLDMYAGWRSPHDHPEQVIWSHRRGGTMRYLGHLPFSGRGASRRRLQAAWWALRWWIRQRRNLLQPRTYVLKARAVRGK